MPIIPYVNVQYYTLAQIAQLTGWTKHNISQRANTCKFERITAGVYTRKSVDRYLLARNITAQAAKHGRRSPHLLWPDKHGRAEWQGQIYEQE